MKNKYINIIKWSFVILTVLLIVVCFLLSSSYSNFVYNSDNHRAVEMIVSKLNYKIKINGSETENISVKPGINVLNIEIESLNNVDSYFKFLVEKNINIFYLDDFLEGLLQKNESKSFRVVVFNNSGEEVNYNYYIASGYVNNKLSDVIVPDNYKEIALKFSPLNTFKFSYNDLTFKVLDIKNDNTIDLISVESIVTDKVLKGAKDYINYEEELNNALESTINIPNVRNVSVQDIEKYTDSKLVNVSDKVYSKSDNFFIPFNNENNYIVDNNYQTHEITINNKTKDSIYDEVFFNTDYNLSDSYSKLYNDYLEWGIMSVENNNIVTHRLYDFNNNENTITLTVKLIVTLPSDTKINYDVINDIYNVLN